MSTRSRSWWAGSGGSWRMYSDRTPPWPRLGQGDEALRDVSAKCLACGHSVSRCTSVMKSALAIDGTASSYSPP
jgi:hypothetical protein